MAIIFSDNFETNDFSNWTGETTGGGAVIETVSDIKYAGDYSTHFSTPEGSWATEYKTLASPYTDLYVREYARLNALPSSGNLVTMMGLFNGVPSDAGTIAVVALYNDGGTPYWAVKWRNGAVLTLEISSSVATIGAFHCVELRAKVDATVGVIQVWVDGSIVVNLSEKTTNAVGNIDNVSAEAGTYGYTSLAEDWVDNYIVSTTYIGQDVAPRKRRRML